MLKQSNDRRGDASEKLFAALIDRYAGLVYAAARGVLAAFPAEEAEDCALDVFTYLFERRDALDFTTPKIKGYLAKCAKSFAFDRVKKLRREAAIPIDSAASSPQSEKSAESVALSREEQRRLVECIQALGEPDATLIMRRYYFCESTKVIAKETGLKENTIDQRVRRARIKLMADLKGLEIYAAE